MSQTNDFGINQDSIAAAPSDETADIEPSSLEDTAQKRGLKINRRYTTPGVHPFDTIEWEHRSSIIYNEKGEVIFEKKRGRGPVKLVAVGSRYRGVQIFPQSGGA